MKHLLQQSAVSGIIGGVISAIVSVLLAAYVLPFPEDKTHYVVGYGIEGLICGLSSGFMGVFMYIKQSSKR